MNQAFTEGEIIKSILRKRGIKQEELALQMKIGRTRLNMLLNSHVLPGEYRDKIMTALKLTDADLPPRPEEPAQPDMMTPVMEVLQTLLDGQRAILDQNRRILEMLEARA